MLYVAHTYSKRMHDIVHVCAAELFGIEYSKCFKNPSEETTLPGTASIFTV